MLRCFIVRHKEARRNFQIMLPRKKCKGNTMKKSNITNFDQAPDSALVSLNDAGSIASRSRASLYRDNKAGRLPFVKVCGSTRIRVSDLRKLISGVA